jgi:hypothetical protein
LPEPHGPGLNGLRRPSLVTGGAGQDLPPTRRAKASLHSHRLGSAPQLQSVLPRGRRRHLQRLPLSGLRHQPRTLSINAFGRCSNVREDTTGRAKCQDRFLADSNVTGPQSDTLWMPNYGPGPLPILTLDSARYLTRLSTFPATCLGRASLGTPVVPIRSRADFRFDA